MFYRLWNRRRREPEPPPVGNRDRQFRGLFAGVPLIIGLVVVSVLALLIVFHIRFMRDVEACRGEALASTNGRVIEEEAPYFLQPMGSLSSELYSPELADEVDQALHHIIARAQRQGVLSGDFRSVPTMTWEIEAAQAGGSYILLHCP